MVPSKSRKSSSRRSSILKPPKPRQPLQNVNFNSSSNESSPSTGKLKRRVSFAEKKHVKEFCNSLEQGTVWDNTYEEHDLSSLKHACPPSQAKSATEDTSNICVNELQNELHSSSSRKSTKGLALCSPQGDVGETLTSNEVPKENQNVTDSDLNFTDPIETIQSASALGTQEVESESPRQSNVDFSLQASKSVISVYTDEDKNVADAIIDHVHKSNMENVDPTDLEETCIQDAPMEFTGVIGNSLCSSRIYGDEKGTGKENDCMMSAMIPTMPLSVFQNTSMEMTQAVPTAISLLKSNIEQLHHTKEVVDSCRVADNETHYFHNASLEYTVALGSLRAQRTNRFQDDPVRNVEEHTQHLDTSMEFTMAVPTALKSVINAVYANTNEHHIEDERTTVFQDAPMEFTTAVSIMSGGKNIASQEVQDLQLNLDDAQGSNSNRSNSKANDRTMLFNDISMEITSAVRTIENCRSEAIDALATVTAPQDRNEIIEMDERTRRLDVSMEMTRAIGVNIHPIEIRTNLNAMDCETVHTLENNIVNKNGNVNSCEGRTVVNNTTVYSDEPMEFTTALSAFSKGPRKSLPNNSAVAHDKTTIFQNQSITMTAAVPSIYTRDNNPETEAGTFDSDLNQEKASNKTVLYPNVSMEVTDAISSLIRRPRLTTEPTVLDAEEAALLKNIGKENIPYDVRIHATELTTATNVVASAEATMEITAAVSNPLMKSRAASRNENSTPERSLRGFKNDDPVTEVALNGPENLENRTVLHESLDRPKRHSDQIEGVAENACLSIATVTNPPANVATSTNAVSDTSVESCLHHSKRIRIHEDSESTVAGKTPAEQSFGQTPVHKYLCNSSMTRDNLLATNKESTELPAPENDGTFCFKASDKESRATSTLRHLDSSQDAWNISGERFLEKSVTFFHEGLEELDAVKPPSFLYADDSTNDNVSANTEQEARSQNHRGTNQETAITSGVSIIANATEDAAPTHVQDPQCDYRDYNLVRDDQMRRLTVDLTRKSQTFEIGLKNVDADVNTSRLEVEDQIRLSEVQKLQFTCMDNTNVVDQGLECTSSSLKETTDRASVYRTKDATVAEEEESRLRCAENKELECTSPTTSNYREEIPLPDVEIGDMEDTEVPIVSERIEKDCSTDKIESFDEHNESHVSIRTERLEDNEDTFNTESVDSDESHVDHKEKDISVELDVFSSLVKKLKVRAQSDDIIWDVYHENVERNLIVIGFISCSLLVVLFLTDDNSDISIRELKMISRLADDADTLIHIVHQIILEKVDPKKLTYLYKSYDDILPMLEHISTEVKLSIDFMFDVKRLDDLNLMEITRDRISFVSRTGRMDIILKVTVRVKPFNKLQPCDVVVDCLLGSVREDDVKQLITNVKRDYKFLRRYMSDVRDYIYLMEEPSSTVKKHY